MFNVHKFRKGQTLNNPVPVATNTNQTLFRNDSVLGTTGPNFLKSQKRKVEENEPDVMPSSKRKRKYKKRTKTKRRVNKKYRSKIKKTKRRKRSVGKRRRLKNYL